MRAVSPSARHPFRRVCTPLQLGPAAQVDGKPVSFELLPSSEWIVGNPDIGTAKRRYRNMPVAECHYPPLPAIRVAGRVRSSFGSTGYSTLMEPEQIKVCAQDCQYSPQMQVTSDFKVMGVQNGNSKNPVG
jgi:hypothetical protein